MARDERGHKLSDEEIIDQVITIINSGYETFSTTSMMAVKYLHDHPKALEELRVSAKLFLGHRFPVVADSLHSHSQQIVTVGSRLDGS